MRRHQSIAQLVADGRLERVNPDPGEASDLVVHALAHLESARTIAEQDPAGAYQLLYDASRKAVAADMLAAGYRAKADRPGAHAAVVAYAQEALASSVRPEVLSVLDQMRRLRNRTEYGALTLGAEQVKNDLTVAELIVSAVRARLPAT